MGMLSFVDSKKQFGRQLLLMDSGDYRLRTLPILWGCLMERENGVPVRAWPYIPDLLFPFDGYKGEKPGMVMICTERNLIFDPWGIIPAAKREQEEKICIKKLCEARRQQLYGQPPKSWMADKGMLFLGCGTMFNVVVMGIRYALS